MKPYLIQFEISDHLRNVADVAEKFAAPFHLGAEAKLAGLLHDLAKCAHCLPE